MAFPDLNTVYKDIDLKFMPHPLTGDLVKKTGVSAITQSIRNLVLTAEGEFVGELDVGGGVFRLLFKNNTKVLSYNLQAKIRETIENHEPRAELKEVNVYSTDTQGEVFVNVVFYALNQEVPFTETIKLSRLR